jgi:hypothetical protein
VETASATGGPSVERVRGVKELIHVDEAVRLVRRGARSVMGNVRRLGPTCQKSFQNDFLLWTRMEFSVRSKYS